MKQGFTHFLLKLCSSHPQEGTLLKLGKVFSMQKEKYCKTGKR